MKDTYVHVVTRNGRALYVCDCYGGALESMHLWMMRNKEKQNFDACTVDTFIATGKNGEKVTYGIDEIWLSQLVIEDIIDSMK